jgi:hypothetical protein
MFINPIDFIKLQRLAIDANYFEKSRTPKYVKKYIGDKGKWVYVYENPNYDKQYEKAKEIQDEVSDLKDSLRLQYKQRSDIVQNQEEDAGEYQQKYGGEWYKKWEADNKHNEYGNMLQSIDDEIDKINNAIQKKVQHQIEITPDVYIHKESDENVPASLLRAKIGGLISGTVYKSKIDNELEKAKTAKKKIIRDNEIKSGSPEDYSSMSAGEKLAHHFYAAQHHDNNRKNGAKKLAEYATKLSEGHLSQEDYGKLVKTHNQSINTSHKNFQVHVDNIKQLGGIDGLDETERMKAGNWINTHYSDEDKEQGFKVNPEKVSGYFEKYADLHNQKYPKSDLDFYNDINHDGEEAHDLDDIHAVYSQIKDKDLNIKGHKNPQEYTGKLQDKIETLKGGLKFDNKKLDDNKISDILTRVIKTKNKKKEIEK